MKIKAVRSLVAIASAFFCVACAEELREISPAYDPDVSGGEVKTVEFIIPGFVEEGQDVQTKTTLTSHGFVWAEKDTVGIFPSKGNQIYYEMSSGAGGSSAQFDGGGWALKNEYRYSSYYPFQGNIYLNNSAIPVKYSTEVTQTGNDNSDHLGENAFMFAPETTLENDKVTFKFWQLGSVLKPRVTLPAGTYTKLVLSTDEPIFVVSGKYDLTTGVDATDPKATVPSFVPVIEPDKEKAGVESLTNTLTINLEDVTFTKETELITYIMAAPVDVSEIPITVTIYCGDSPRYMYEFVRTSTFVAQSNHNIRPNEKGLMPVANSSESANAAFAAGETSLSFIDVIDGADLDLVLPATDSPVNISMAADEGSCTMNVAYPAGSTKPATISIQASDGSNIVLATPESTVTLDGERTYESVRAATASNTLIIGEDVTIGTLYLEKGNVEVYGEIMALNTDDLEEGETPTVYVYGNIQGQIDDDENVTVRRMITGVALGQTSLEMESGETVQLLATTVPENAIYHTVKWTSSNTSVATVTDDGLVTAVASGECTITVDIDGKQAMCKVSVAESDKPLTFISSGSTSIAIIKHYSPNDIVLEYRIDNGDWTILPTICEQSAYYSDDSAANFIDLEDGQTLQFRAGSEGNDTFSQFDNHISTMHSYYGFVTKGTGTLALSGNVMSLLDRTMQRTTLTSFVFHGLFYGCQNIVDASDLILPAITLSQSCYLEMFGGCMNLVSAPELPATELASGCYMGMFDSCHRLAEAPELPAKKLAPYCYESMFFDCRALTSAPELPAATLESRCYNQMFYHCENLHNIEALFTTTPSYSYTDNWLYGVSASGRFVKNEKAHWDLSGPAGIPEGWTVETVADPLGLPTSGGVEIQDVGYVTATVASSFTTDASEVTEYGFYYGTSLSSMSRKKATSNSNGAYSVQFAGLSAGTTYYIKAFAKNEAGIAESAVATFTTTATTGSIDGHEWVDLGIRTSHLYSSITPGSEADKRIVFAKMNIGATSMYSPGYFFRGRELYGWSYSGSTSSKVALSGSNVRRVDKDGNTIGEWHPDIFRPSDPYDYYYHDIDYTTGDAVSYYYGSGWRYMPHDIVNKLFCKSGMYESLPSSVTATNTNLQGLTLKYTFSSYGLEISNEALGTSVIFPAGGLDYYDFVREIWYWVDGSYSSKNFQYVFGAHIRSVGFDWDSELEEYTKEEYYWLIEPNEVVSDVFSGHPIRPVAYLPL